MTSVYLRGLKAPLDKSNFYELFNFKKNFLVTIDLNICICDVKQENNSESPNLPVCHQGNVSYLLGGGERPTVSFKTMYLEDLN